MTSGERRFARRLESHLEDDYVCWYNVPVGAWNRHPDFLILHPRRGLLVIEVKDWKLENVRAMDKLTATLQVDGREVRKSNPLEQAKQYAFGVCRLLESDPALVGESGTAFQGKLVFPWGYGVVLANITRKQFAGTDLGDVIPSERVICQDEMVESVDAEAFQQRLWGMFGVTFKCLLTLPQVDRVRWHLFPEIRVSQGTFDLGSPAAPVAGIVPDIVRVMDLQQEQLARSMGDGHRVIHGVAGSGKTMILGYRAQYLAQALAKPILILCFNRALAARLQQMVDERGMAATVSARSFHGWCNDQLRLYHLRRPEGTGDAFIEQLVQTVIQGVDSGKVPRAQYGAVLVDEGHDFEPEWLKLVAQMVHPETNSLLVLYDDAQNINRRKARLGFSFADVGIQARGRTTILRMNYRNTAQIMAVACEFARDQLSAKEAEEDAIPLVAPQSAGRSGALPELRGFKGEAAELDYVVEQARALHDKGTAWNDMAILFRYMKQGERFAQAVARAGIPCDLLQGNRYLPAKNSLKILSMHSSKGLEFPVVFLPCLDAMPAPSQEVAAEAKLLYVAMTRAMERLHMTHHARSVFVDRLRAALGAGAVEKLG
ncbi:MAG: DEAD/DEAH box helicase [Burkholderiales bacterium]